MILNSRLRRQIARNQQKQLDALRNHELFPLAMQRFFKALPYKVEKLTDELILQAVWFMGAMARGSKVDRIPAHAGAIAAGWWVDVNWRKNIFRYATA